MPHLFSPFTLGGLTLKNRLAVSPMCQYSAIDGIANDWHFAHLARFALGGFGLVTFEATAVTDVGRITYGDLGLWNDDQIAPLARIVDFLHTQGSAAAIQLAHAGRKASTPVPWRQPPPATDAEKQAAGFADWQPVAPSAVPHAPGFAQPHALSETEITETVQAFVAAARRAKTAGFDVIELHGAHGYLIDQFLSPLANKRTDKYGGSRENRMRLALEIADAVRTVWDGPLTMRLSVQDWHKDGWQVEDSIALALQLKQRGVDAIDCSSGGFAEAHIELKPGYQVPFAAAVRKQADMPTIAVGLINSAAEAEAIIANGQADLVMLARAALDDPNFPLHAQRLLDPGADYAAWPPQAGYGIAGRDKALAAFAVS